MERAIVVLNKNDNVGVALIDLEKDRGYLLDEEIHAYAIDNIKYGHKIALYDINQGEDVIKYGEVIGYALKDIKKGEWVHTHNLGMDLEGSE